MKHSLSRRGAPRALWQATPVAAAAAALLMGGLPAQAQTAPPAEGAAPQVITITGIRRGIESAISVKKNADGIVEAISAEDLGKMPDISIAESVSRLPGVAAQRTAGRAQQISIRGMAPDFGTSLLNGREQASTGDSRSAEFDQYPSELLAGLRVYKTPDGALVGQGLSGTVDLQTVRPLDFSSRTVALAYRKNKLNVDGGGEEGDGSRFSIMYVDQFADRTIGVALGFARLDEEGGVTSRFDSWGGGQAKLNGTGADLNVPYNGFGVFADQEKRKRDGVAATLQFRPNKNFTSTLDYFASKFDKVKTTTGFQAPLNDSWNGSPGPYDSGGVLTQATVSGSDVTAGTFNNVRAVVRNDSESTKDKLTSIGWNNQFKLDDTLTLIGDISRSTAKRTGGIIETTAGTAQSTLGTAQLDTLQFTSNGGFTPGLNYTDRNLIKLTDVQGWGGGTAQPQAGYSKLPYVKDTIDGLRLAARKDLQWGPVISVEGGVHLSSREKERSFTEGRLLVIGDTNGLASAAIPGSGTTAVRTPAGGTISVASFDSSTSVGSVYNVVPKLNPDIYNKDWKLKEKVTTAYAKGDIDTELFGLPVRGNAGLQIVATDQQSNAFNVDRRTCTSDAVCPAVEGSRGATYTDVLPSLNLAADLGSNNVLRFALARVMARPKVDDMRASSRFDYDATKGLLTGDGGNPELKPFRANAIDLSYEQYYGNKAYWGVAAFYKDMNTYIVNVTDPTYDFAQFLPPGTPIPPGVNTIGEFTRPTNGKGGRISGIELSANFPLNMLSSVLDGFGMFASYANTSSSLKLTTGSLATDSVNTGTIPLPGLSKKVINYAVYFEKWGFSARVAARKRSDFVGEVADFAGDRRLTYIKGETITDVQVGYEIQTGAFKGLAVRAEISNTGNTPFIRYRDVPGNEVENKKDGKYYQVGLNYKF